MRLCFSQAFGVREWSKNAPGTRTIIFPVSIPHIVHSRPISTQFLPFRPSPMLCISGRQRLCISGRQRLCMSGRQRLLLFSTKRISVCLRNREYCSSATRKFGPNPSYLRSGEFVLPWDTKNRSSHTQIVHIEILRAQMYLKSDETEGNLLPEHMNIFARNRLLAPKGEC